MSRARAVSDLTKTPHSVSLKVLRLSRPHLVEQFPVPGESPNGLPPLDSRAALSCPTSQLDEKFVLSPVLALPSSFGRAHVGEVFACALCANNEVTELEDSPLVTRIQLAAEMQSPSGTTALDLDQDTEAVDPATDPNSTLQRIIKFELREEGNHVLAVTVSYVEEPQGAQSHEGAERTRTFRKLYQFYGQHLLSVRTKTQLHPVQSKSGQPVYTLEAQLENLGHDPLVLEKATVMPLPAFTSRSLNVWDREKKDGMRTPGPTLNSRDVLQVAFLLYQKPGVDGEDIQQNPEGRTVVGQLSMHWRGAMGEPGSLSTGWLSAR